MPPKKPTPPPKPAQSSKPPQTALDFPFSTFITVSNDPICPDQYLSATDTPTPLVNAINSLTDLPFGISNIPNDPKGRCAVAKYDIPAGTTLICEQTPLWVVSTDNLSDFCHHCGLHVVAQPGLQLLHDESGFYTWCSKACQDAMQAFYTVETPLFAVYQHIASTCNIEINLLRLAAKYLILKYLRNLKLKAAGHIVEQSGIVNEDPAQQAMRRPYLQSQSHVVEGLHVIRPNLDDIDSLQLHIQHQTDEGILITAKRTIQQLHPILSKFEKGTFLPTLYSTSSINPQNTNAPEDGSCATGNTKSDAKVDDDFFEALQSDLLKITGRINANIHSLQTYPIDPTVPRYISQTLHKPTESQLAGQDVLETRLQLSKQAPYDTFDAPFQYGMGLYPICAMINHSCEPNSLFINQGQSLCIRTIAAIKRGEEIYVNYTALNSDALQRRLDLLAEKGFWCGCRRCMFEIDENQILLPVLEQGVRVGTNASNNAGNLTKPGPKTQNGKSGHTSQKPAQTAKSDKNNQSTQASAQTAAPTLINDATNSFNQSELNNEKLIRLLSDRFVTNSLRSSAITLLENAKVIPDAFFQDEEFSFSCLSRENFEPQLLDKHVVLKPVVLAFFAFLEKNVKVLTTDQIVEQLSVESTQINTCLESYAKELRTAYNTAKNAGETVSEAGSTPSTDASASTQQSSHNVLSTINTGAFLSKVNAIYPGGLEFPVFSTPNPYPSLVEHWYPTLQRCLTWVATKPQISADNQRTEETTQSPPTSSPRRSFLILFVNVCMNLLFLQALEAVQSQALPFVEKKKKIERFSSFRHFFYPLGLYHNQYQIMMLVSNITSASCPSVAQFAGCKAFFTTVLPSVTLLFTSNMYNFPSIFLSFVEICQYVLNTLKKAEDLMGKYSSGSTSTPISKKFIESMRPVVVESKKTILRRMNAVVRTLYGPHHIQNFYFAQLK